MTTMGRLWPEGVGSGHSRCLLLNGGLLLDGAYQAHKQRCQLLAFLDREAVEKLRLNFHVFTECPFSKLAAFFRQFYQ